MKRGITHKAIITGLAPDGLLVRVLADSDGAGCAGCAIVDVCRLQSPVSVPYANASADMVGRTAILRIDAPAAPVAMMWLIGVPLVILVVVLCALIALGLSQGWAALGAIAVATVWYMLVHRIHAKRDGKRSPEYTILEIV